MVKGRARKDRHQSDLSTLTEFTLAPFPKAKPKGPMSPLTERQRVYIASILHNIITFGVGPAGTGKTYVAARIAGSLLKKGEIEKIYLTRPAVESGRPIGFLPGTLDEKLAPYMASYARGFTDELGGGHFDYALKARQIEPLPLNFMQGLSWDESCIVLFDEAENATPAEMKMFLTRIGEGARVVIDGDPDQAMIQGRSGLVDAIQKTEYIKSVSTVRFSKEDIVRSGIVREILEVYERSSAEPETTFEPPDFLTRSLEC